MIYKVANTFFFFLNHFKKYQSTKPKPGLPILPCLQTTHQSNFPSKPPYYKLVIHNHPHLIQFTQTNQAHANPKPIMANKPHARNPYQT